MGAKSTASQALRTCAAALAVLSAAPPAHADWRADIGTFRIGIVAEPGGGNTVPGLARLTDAYTNALGMKVEFVVARDYAALIEAQASGRIQYAVYSALAYATASERCGCVEPLVAPVDADGAAGVRSVLVTRDGKVPGLTAIASHRIAIAPADNVVGSLLPLTELAGEGVPIAQDSPFLARASSATAAEAMLGDGEADGLFGWEPIGADGQPTDTGGTIMRLAAAGVPKTSLRVLWSSAPLRYGPHVVRSDLDAEAKRRLTVFLTNLKSLTPDVYDLLEPTHSGGFELAVSKDYATALAIVRRETGGD
ncbi:MAG: phosphonate ABC transporter substrate-binding protein [Mesorhizobium sp.]|nr:PhnD/SsuA/transferrin family substrate-binding protein [Mesorhizobium sp.]RUV42127.1 phosphonate ABC transporter substrate-binding protein [Mesorhizobium sp. M1A.T.Ca.IN.004.03.1.1]RWG18956.1 MAG: phosphonate ABC transporter substrate-binding protein [Mesorhizobium sp.]RWK33938.1 MAG: phosphonate ABC transporter substrate-binding protein [Mesorhizobium sp.]RWK87491.1 MAG: phosphonate ABC transporter substrate-binding protein [Mesorhizobium sp.]TIP19647.1 MAG: phosphonate ABC transporter sub